MGKVARGVDKACQVDDYVFGYALREVQELEEHQRGWPSNLPKRK